MYPKPCSTPEKGSFLFLQCHLLYFQNFEDFSHSCKGNLQFTPQALEGTSITLRLFRCKLCVSIALYLSLSYFYPKILTTDIVLKAGDKALAPGFAVPGIAVMDELRILVVFASLCFRRMGGRCWGVPALHCTLWTLNMDW